MIYKHITKILLLTLLLFFCGCGSLIKQPSPIISYYQLDYSPGVTKSAPVNKTILIKPFFISETYNRDSIMYSDDKYKCNYYPYKRWISSPQDPIMECFRRDFIKSKAFKGLIIPGQLLRPDFILSGAITEIQEKRGKEKSEGTVKINMTLLKPAFETNPEKIIFQKNYSKSIPCEIDNTESLVKALSQATKEISGEVLKDVVAAAK